MSNRKRNINGNTAPEFSNVVLEKDREDSWTDGMRNKIILCKVKEKINTLHTRVVPKVMSNFFLHANWEQQTKESAVVDGTSCCVILECLVTSTAYIT